MDLFNKEKLRKANDKITELSTTIEKRDKKLDERTGELSKEKQHREQAEEDLRTARHTITTLENKNTDLNKTIIEITEESKDAIAGKSFYFRKYEEMKKNNIKIGTANGGLTKEVNKLKNEISIVSGEKEELSTTNKSLIKERDEATELARKLTEENQKLKNKPAVPNIQELKEYEENPKKYSRNRKGKLVHVNN